MPQVTIQIRADRDPRRVRRMIGAVTDAVVAALDTPPASVRVVVMEVPATHWANGGVTLAERAEAQDEAEVGRAASSGASVTEPADTTIQAVAAEIDAARVAVREIDQFAGRVDLSLSEAYGVLLSGIELRQARGERTVGLKLGFTSREKAQQMGVSDVILGVLTDEMLVASGGAIRHANLIHPRVEPEVAFRLSDELPDDVLSRPEGLLPYVTHVAAALEVIDSRYRSFRFNLQDVVADNTSGSRFALGDWHEFTPTMREGALNDLEVALRFDGSTVASGTTRAILGDPVAALAAAARLATRYNHPLRPGAVVLAGSATEAVALPVGTHVEVEVQGLTGVSVHTVAHEKVTR